MMAGVRSEEGVIRSMDVKTKPTSLSTDFVRKLENLQRGERAVLRRNAGLSLGESRGGMGLFYRLMPMRLGPKEEIFFLVATLFPLNDKPSPAGDFGQSMAFARQRSESEALDRRMTILLDSELEWLEHGGLRGGELGFRLRQAVKLLASQEVGVHWEGLLEDLLQWSHPDKWVQKRWARSYFNAIKSDNNEGGANNAS